LKHSNGIGQAAARSDFDEKAYFHQKVSPFCRLSRGGAYTLRRRAVDL
jgi:hypothetical protein